MALRKCTIYNCTDAQNKGNTLLMLWFEELDKDFKVLTWPLHSHLITLCSTNPGFYPGLNTLKSYIDGVHKCN